MKVNMTKSELLAKCKHKPHQIPLKDFNYFDWDKFISSYLVAVDNFVKELNTARYYF